MVTYRELVNGFRSLGMDSSRPVIVHTSLSAFGEVHGGVDTLLGALLYVFPKLMAPTHTYKTMLIPGDGPSHNGMVYGGGHSLNAMAEMYYPDMPADSLMGVLPEALRKHPQARRSKHPILSFAGVGVDDLLAAQTLAAPLAPLGELYEADGYVLLLGVGHTVNTSLHYAEKTASRRTFVRWAVTPEGVVECPGFPCCSLGFDEAAPTLANITVWARIGPALVQGLPVREMVDLTAGLVREDPLALLCSDPACERCAAVREELDYSGD